MVHRKYTQKNGKSYGPYLYENKRVGNKVVTNYVGKPQEKRIYYAKIALISFILLTLLAGIIYLIYTQTISPTGRVSLQVSLNYQPGESILGDMKFNIKEGELIPLDSKVNIIYGNQSKILSLQDLIYEQPISGDFYAEDTNISGSGEGYGLE